MAKASRRIIMIDEERCDGCGLCIPSCKEGALKIVAGKVRLVSDVYCDGLGACLGECPRGALSIVEREADEFNEAAVEQNLKSPAKPAKPARRAMQAWPAGQGGGAGEPCGCPGSMPRSFEPKSAATPVADSRQPSELRQWPIQLKLLNPAAPYLKGADLVLMADCTAFAYGSAHRDFIRGRRIAIACPKLDETDSYAPKLARIIEANGIRSIEVVVMEVPCCQGLAAIAEEAIAMAGGRLILKKTTMGIEGEVKKDGGRALAS